jgi:diguanylate cyclase (GGDEF)-like protein
MKVLVVEDNKPISLVICRIISSMGHDVVTVENGEDAVHTFMGEEIDLILMDVEMPGIDGFETTRRIRALIPDQWIPIIFLSANSEESYLAKGIDAGGDDYLVKPVKPVVLKAKIRAMERIAQMRNALKIANEDLAKANEELERLSCSDGLTAAVNRRGFDQQFQLEWKRATRSEIELAILMIDIDQFKKYNDRYGHLEGDDCLRTVARTIQSCLLRPADMLARYGGEEFVVLLPDTSSAGALEVAERMREAVFSLKIKHESCDLYPYVSISIGVNATDICPTIHANQFLNAADKALYTAKQAGRNCCMVYGVEIGAETPQANVQ